MTQTVMKHIYVVYGGEKLYSFDNDLVSSTLVDTVFDFGTSKRFFLVHTRPVKRRFRRCQP